MRSSRQDTGSSHNAAELEDRSILLDSLSSPNAAIMDANEVIHQEEEEKHIRIVFCDTMRFNHLWLDCFAAGSFSEKDAASNARCSRTFRMK